MMLSTFTTSHVLLVAALVSSTASAEFIGLRNFEHEAVLSSTPEGGFGNCTMPSDCAGLEQCSNNGNNGGNLCWCSKEEGECDGDGKCVKINPGFAKRSLRQVCGCDGNTYSNADVAAIAGVNVEHAGTCPESPSMAPSMAPSQPSLDVTAVE